MKRIKKIASLLLAMVMVFAMSVTAFATTTDDLDDVRKDEGNLSITLKNDQAGHTYTAYQVFKGDLSVKNGESILSNIEWGTGVNEDGLIAAIKAGVPAMASLPDDASAADVAKALKDVQNDSETAIKFADVIGHHLGSAFVGQTCTEQTTGEGEEKVTTGYVISGLNAGYYLVQDTGIIGANDAATRYILEVVTNQTVDVKTEVPEIEKKIVEGDKEVDANTAGVGQVVSFRIKGEIPNHTGYNKYFYVINDTLSSGLTFNHDIKVTIGGQLATLNKDYYVYTGDEAEGNTFQVAIADVLKKKIGDEVVVEYSATVNDNAIIGNTGNPNTVTLTYSNNPGDTNDGDPNHPGKPGSNVPTGKTPEDKTITYVAEIEIIKTASDIEENNGALAGAEFTLTGDSKITVLTERKYYEVDPNGQYYLLKDGTYTTDAPQAEEKDAEGNVITESNENLYVDATLGVKYAEKVATVTEEKTVPVKMVVVSDANGKVVFKGLGKGTYTIEETGVPAGYNKAENKVVVIDGTVPDTVTDGSETMTWIIGTGSDENVTLKDGGTMGVYGLNIVNQKGSLLPSTGGIGTTIFYVVGGILVIGAGILLVTKRRMKAQ